MLQNVLKCPIGFNGFQIMCFTKLCVYSVFQFPHRIKRVFKLCASKSFQIQWFSNFPIGFNFFQSMCFKIFHMFQWLSNDLFQSFFKFCHRFQWFSNFPIGFNGFQICFKFSNFPIGLKCFQSCVSKCFQNYVFQSVF